MWVGLPNVVFGAFGLTAASLILFLPETLGHSLPESVAEAETFGTKYEYLLSQYQPTDYTPMGMFQNFDQFCTTFPAILP